MNVMRVSFLSLQFTIGTIYNSVLSFELCSDNPSRSSAFTASLVFVSLVFLFFFCFVFFALFCVCVCFVLFCLCLCLFFFPIYSYCCFYLCNLLLLT